MFAVTSIVETPSGPEAVAVISTDEREYKYNLSPTTLAEALCIVDYPSAPDNPCLERVDE